jgi:uncharacterized protein
LIVSLELLIFLALLSLAASFVNGGMGYGYSSLSVPLAILVIANKIINPVYVLVEACMNTVMLGFAGKANIKATFRRVIPIVLPIVPGVIIGSYLLSLIAPLWVKLVVYAVLLPLILLQVSGFKKPIKKESAAGVPLGMGIGLLYSITTISGPPIALFWNNQGMAKNEFKAAVAQVRIAESYLTCISYAILGLFTATTFQLFTVTALPVLLGIPLGMIVLSKVAAETFSRSTMTFNAGVVSFGLAQVFISLLKMPTEIAYSFWGVVLAIDVLLFYRFFKNRSKVAAKPPAKLEVPVPKGT